MATATVHGGHHLVLEGAPTDKVERLPAPSRIRLLRRHRFVEFSTAAVEEGDGVQAGQVLARGADEFDFPLLTPVAGSIVDVSDDGIGIEVAEDATWDGRVFDPLAWETASADALRTRIRDAGLWPTLHVAPDGEVPWRIPGDDRRPAFIVVGAAQGEPHLADPRLVLHGRDGALTEATAILRRVSGTDRVLLATSTDDAPPPHAGVEVLRLSERSPNDNVLVQCDAVDRGAYAWGLDVQDALAIRDAVVAGAVPTERIIALGGGLVHQPVHLRAAVGTPLAEVTRGRLVSGRPRFLHGGMLTGREVLPEKCGVASWCRGVNVIEEPVEREFLSFLRPGADRDSFMNAFLSNLFPDRPRTTHAAIRGERRACVNCTACHWVCPVELMPSILWKFATHDMVDEANALGLKRCVECGLCTYVCPSKIELADTFRTAHAQVRTEAAEERALRAEEG